MHNFSLLRKLRLGFAASLIALAASAGAGLTQTAAPGAPTPLGPGARQQPYQAPPPGQQAQGKEESTFSADEILSTGHKFC